jgi:hypothetical protein
MVKTYEIKTGAAENMADALLAVDASLRGLRKLKVIFSKNCDMINVENFCFMTIGGTEIVISNNDKLNLSRVVKQGNWGKISREFLVEIGAGFDVRPLLDLMKKMVFEKVEVA